MWQGEKVLDTKMQLIIWMLLLNDGMWQIHKVNHHFSNTNKLLPVHSSPRPTCLTHSSGLNPRCTHQVQRQEQAWQTVMQLTKFRTMLSAFFLFLSALMAFQAGSIKQGVSVVQSRGFISPLGATDLLLSWEKKSNDKEAFQHEKIWWGRELLRISLEANKLL